MKVWAVRRRDAGAILSCPEDGLILQEPLELRIETTTDQGTRAPIKVARLKLAVPLRTIVELTNVRLFRLSDQALLLVGIERGRDDYKNVIGCMQSWYCRMAPPFDQGRLRIRKLFKRGAKEQNKDYWWPGPISLRFEQDSELGRITAIAEVGQRGTMGYQLLDADIAWMGEDRYQLDGFERHGAWIDKPSAVFQQSWLCAYDFPVPTEGWDKRDM
ncbi:hypothetical protein [Massilia endophytica]|uniref:hypothetical protein n=1 Tax=Massilia endophytica TaxID=2899220 RepID=UPI001E454A32|nr:hypothetical protein [Massilia endophytica]UGQ45066.1 hypothetical protein LSQ66_14830 [Massilia endophytica]